MVDNDLQFEKCFAPKAMMLSWERANISIGSDAKDYFGISIYQSNIKKRLDQLSERILNGKYQPLRPFKYFEPKSTGTQRTKTVLNIEDALVYQAIGNHIAELLYQELEETRQSVFGSVLNANVKNGVKLLDEETEDYYFFEYYVNLYNRFIDSIDATVKIKSITHILETDITGFFDAIPHSVLILELKKRGVSKPILDLLAICLNVWSGTRDEITPGVGIPQGPAASYLFANILLDRLDRFVIKTGVYYYRFMDDIRIYGKSNNELLSILVGVDRCLKGMSLSLNAQKTSIKSIDDLDKEKDQILDSSTFEIELDALDFDPETKEQIKSDPIGGDSEIKIIDNIYATKLYQLLIGKAENNIGDLVYGEDNDDLLRPTKVREFLTLAHDWRKLARALSGNSDWKPDHSFIPVWLNSIPKFYWKSNHIVWNLRYYSLDGYYEKINELIDHFNDYEWIQYQLLQLIGELVLDDKEKQLECIRKINVTSSPLVRLGYYKVMLHTIKTDSKLFETLAISLKAEENEFVKNSVMNAIHLNFSKISLDILNNWFR